MLRFLVFLVASFLTIAAQAQAQAQERSRVILVLDGSGSMWGQIDGVAKITIAQQVIDNLLTTLPPEQELGLTVYGHRRKGDCSDIETLILPQGDQRAAISAAVNAIKPKGKTPLSAAVVAAAEALRYEEDRATVVLVSDGRETCELDPCKVGETLEETGIDFTAHVIGFDVSDPADRAELQCLAERTGGTFRTASSASELGDALAVVAVPPAPEPVQVTLRAVAGAGGPVIGAGLSWNAATESGEVVLPTTGSASPVLDLLPGDYSASVTRLEDGARAAGTFTVSGDDKLVTLVLSELAPEPVKVSIWATDGKNGPRINDDLVWELTQDETALVDSELAPMLKMDLIKGEYVVSVLRPADEASVELRFGVGTVNKNLTLVLPEYRPGATIEAPETAVAGSLVDVRWTGPDTQNDFISVIAPDGNKGSWIEYTYTREGPLLKLLMPPLAGAYEIRYVLNDGKKILAKRPITVTPVTAAIIAPETLRAGATEAIDWTGPDYPSDFVAVTERGGDSWINYTYTREGSPMGVQMPGEPGEYDLIYTMNQKRTIIARVPISVTGVEFGVTAPETATAGSTVQVDWTGPDYQNDYVDVAQVGAKNNKYINYTYTREGSPLGLQMPVDPGTYEIRYILAQDRTVMASRTIEVSPLAVTVAAPERGIAGDTIAVDWNGPDYQNDYISVAEVGQKDNAYKTYTYTREGSPLDVVLPLEAGDYEVRYVISQDRTVAARQPIRIEPVTATISSEASAAAGDMLVVTWEGPSYKADFIAISDPDSKDNAYKTYTYTRDGSPLKVQVPATPGQYEVRYVASNVGRKVLMRSALEVTAVSASVEVDATAAPGSVLEVNWTGPGYPRDFLTISKAGDKGYISYVYTREGSPILLKVPDKPGDYEVRYVMGHERAVLTASPLKVE